MILADWVALGLAALFCIFGLIFGFGKGLNFFTDGIFGFFISVIVCYALGGIIYNFGFVQDLLDKLRTALSDKNNGLYNFLLNIHIDIIVYYISLFVVVTILRLIAVKIIKNVMEIENVLLIVLNKSLGVILFLGALLMCTFLVFWVISIIGGATESDFRANLEGSLLKIDYLYDNNPFLTIINALKFDVEMPN